MDKITFESRSKEFARTLRHRVNDHFGEKSKKGTTRVHVKAMLFILTWILLYSLLVFTELPILAKIIFTILFSLTTAGIGFNVMHGGNHNTFSKNSTINKLAGFSVNILGGNDDMWKVKHNVEHHTFTNIHDHDGDVYIGIAGRLHPSQPWYPIHQYQKYYIWVLYMFGYFFWITFMDAKKYILQKSAQKDLNFTFFKHVKFWVSKALFLAVFIYIPMQFLPGIYVFWGITIWILTVGLVISTIFQLAHAVDNVVMVDEPENGIIDEDYSVHQIRTTSNFATQNWLLREYTGGLTHQVEHHLFDKISEVWYPELQPIVKETCAEFGYTYQENTTLWKALKAHVRHLSNMGQRPIAA
ncbi:MAG: acyl-CoA desaturase [Candidatus Pacebacteria bacterium]|nr:acyl-CoA desaturase [Candidatus Paceibacterota bacterium]